jgi:hypothetical protein
MKELAPDVWHVAGPPLRLPGGVRMPLASTVIRLPDRSLLVYSPVAFDAPAVAAIDALGEVAHIVAPSRFHYFWAGSAAKRWPGATVHGAPGLATKCKDATFHRELGGDVDAALRDVIELEVVGGAPRASEAVMFHRPSATLVCADFVFNVTEPANLRTRLVLAMMGAGGRRLAQSRVWKFLVRDRKATRASIDRILGWPIARIAPVHGAAIEMSSVDFAPRLTRSYGGKVELALTSASS